MVLFAWHCIPMVSPSSVASNLRNSPGMLCMTSLLWNSTITLLKHTWVALVIEGSLRYCARLLLYSQLSCKHVPKRISWRNLIKLSSVVVRRFKVINSYRWGTTYNHKSNSYIGLPWSNTFGTRGSWRNSPTIMICFLPNSFATSHSSAKSWWI